MSINLKGYQINAVSNMKNGCILCGGVGSGKSRTALSYYYLHEGGDPVSLMEGEDYIPMSDPPRDLYIITTARKRDTKEWEFELANFLMSTDRNISLYQHNVIVDSWNNIMKYRDVKGAFFIFDEQRVVGSGAWVKSFMKISQKNDWILLSATPGDTWSDYIPVFVANGFYKNRTEFIQEHVIYSRFSKFPKVDRYVNTKRLLRLKEKILVQMEFERQTTAHNIDILVDYDKDRYRLIQKNRWNPVKNEPVTNASELCYELRRCVNTHTSRLYEVQKIVAEKKKVIIFYNFDYELELLRQLDLGDAEKAEYNGHKHQPIPESSSWAYLVQYTAGAEGWNCTKTDTMIFYSQNYSYKVMVQASGRIDRMNTPYRDLYYYHLKSHSGIDTAITRTLKNKKEFNAQRYIKKTVGWNVTPENNKIAALIKRRRLQLLVHSCIYYRFNDNVISDKQWTDWAIELEQLQEKYPDISKTCDWADAFDGFDHSTGFDLPIDDPWVVSKAEILIRSKADNKEEM